MKNKQQLFTDSNMMIEKEIAHVAMKEKEIAHVAIKIEVREQREPKRGSKAI
jgi:hypothetical protein